MWQSALAFWQHECSGSLWVTAFDRGDGGGAGNNTSAAAIANWSVRAVNHRGLLCVRRLAPCGVFSHIVLNMIWFSCCQLCTRVVQQLPRRLISTDLSFHRVFLCTLSVLSDSAHFNLSNSALLLLFFFLSNNTNMRRESVTDSLNFLSCLDYFE